MKSPKKSFIKIPKSKISRGGIFFLGGGGQDWTLRRLNWPFLILDPETKLRKYFFVPHFTRSSLNLPLTHFQTRASHTHPHTCTLPYISLSLSLSLSVPKLEALTPTFLVASSQPIYPLARMISPTFNACVCWQIFSVSLSLSHWHTRRHTHFVAWATQSVHVAHSHILGSHLTHTQGCMHKITLSHTHTHAHTHKHFHTNTRTSKHTHTQTHAHPNTRTLSQMHIH